MNIILKNNLLFKIVFFQKVVKKMKKNQKKIKKGVDNGERIVYKQFHRRSEAHFSAVGVIEKIVNKKRIYRQYILVK